MPLTVESPKDQIGLRPKAFGSVRQSRALERMSFNPRAVIIWEFDSRADIILQMEPLTKSLVTFVLVYLAGLIARSIVAREREQKSFSEGLKDKSNHATSAIVALVAAVSTGFYI